MPADKLIEFMYRDCFDWLVKWSDKLIQSEMTTDSSIPVQNNLYWKQEKAEMCLAIT